MSMRANQMKTSLSSFKLVTLFILVGSALPLGLAHGQSDHNDHDDYVSIGQEFERSWLDPWPHNHFSQRGTPFVHAFNIEPAFLGTDLFISYGSLQGFGEDESELEVELEWAFTRRIGMVVEAPLVFLNPDNGDSELGIGDFAVAARGLLVESERFLLSGNLEVSIPSGKEETGLGSGEVGLSPSFSAWLDLGHWVQAHAQAGAERGLDSGDAEVFYNAALIYTFVAPRAQATASSDAAHSGSHSMLGMTNGILDLSGRTAMNGVDDGRSTAEALFGISHNISKSLEIRGGYQFPVGGNQDFDFGFTLGFVHHF
jgi:hypothetical protein